jgi:pimeloyl-ACP methyl ester carboxylesterase
MGNDIDVFQEGELEETFWKHHGPKHESWSDFFSRTYSGIMRMLTQPKRHTYYPSDLRRNSIDDYSFNVQEITLSGGRYPLHCASWVENRTSKLWVIYLHTNTRSLVDAQEVLPICGALGANLFAFDLPGCGKSAGELTFGMANDLAVVIHYLKAKAPGCEIVLWARGMSTAIAIEYLHKNQSTESSIKFVILDSPFLSVAKMVADASSSITAYGVAVPSPVINFCASFIRRSVRSKLGSDPYELRPIEYAPAMTCPVWVFAALQDDYMPPHHGRQMAEAWGTSHNPKTMAEFEEFEGRHFGSREESTVMRAFPHILQHINTARTQDDICHMICAMASPQSPNNGLVSPTMSSPISIPPCIGAPGFPLRMSTSGTSLATKGTC